MQPHCCCFLEQNESFQQRGDGGCSWGSLCSWQPFADSFWNEEPNLRGHFCLEQHQYDQSSIWDWSWCRSCGNVQISLPGCSWGSVKQQLWGKQGIVAASNLPGLLWENILMPGFFWDTFEELFNFLKSTQAKEEVLWFLTYSQNSQQSI